METRAHYVLIGAFVLFAVAAAFLFVLWLGQTQREYDEYDVIFKERVSGLSKGAAVRFNGIQKGEVVDLSIDMDNPQIVIARVRVDNDTPVKTDTKAELELVGFTGLAIIQLVGGSANAELLKDAVRGVPRLEADTSGFAAFLSGSGEIVEAANTLLSDENTAAFGRILANVDTLTKTLAEEDESIHATLRNAAILTKELAEASKKLNRIASEAESLTPEARETIAEVRALVAEVNDMVSDNREPISAFTQGALAQVGPAISESRRLMRTLDQILREIDRDPRGYFLGESTPSYETGQE